MTGKRLGAPTPRAAPRVGPENVSSAGSGEPAASERGLGSVALWVSAPPGREGGGVPPPMGQTYLALLRAVNVGGTLVDTGALRKLASELGYQRVRSWLATGNLVLDATSTEPSRLESRLERETSRQLGVETTYFVRTVPEWTTMVENNPFPEMARDDPSHLVVVVLRRPPAAEAARRLQRSIVGRETVRAGERCLYATYPDGIGRSKLTLGRIETALGSPGTARNWNTVAKLHELARASP